MDDLIRRQDAIDALLEWYETPKNQDAVDVIRNVPPAQQWVPVSERLPEEDWHYIVYAPTYSGGSSSSKEYHDGVMFSAFKKGKWSIEHGYHKRPNCVVAWMPLPEPYKKSEVE